MFGIVAIVCLMTAVVLYWRDRRQCRRELQRTLEMLPPEARKVWEERNP